MIGQPMTAFLKELHNRAPEIDPVNREKAFRRYLPYGRWTEASGRVLLFNRQYKAIWQRTNGETSPADPNEWIKIVKEEWFFGGYRSPPPWNSLKSLARCLAILRDFGATIDPLLLQYADVRRAAR